jgi:hypothetical protein
MHAEPKDHHHYANQPSNNPPADPSRFHLTPTPNIATRLEQWCALRSQPTVASTDDPRQFTLVIHRKGVLRFG